MLAEEDSLRGHARRFGREYSRDRVDLKWRIALSSEFEQVESTITLSKVLDLCELAADGPYAPQAYAFVQDGLRFAANQVFGDAERVTDDRENLHISGRQLAIGLGEFAIQRYGLLARRVLEHWNIHRTDDFGRIVFRMIDAGLMSRQDDDRLEDFFSVFAFDEAFDPSRIIGIVSSGRSAMPSDLESLAGSSS